MGGTMFEFSGRSAFQWVGNFLSSMEGVHCNGWDCV